MLRTFDIIKELEKNRQECNISRDTIEFISIISNYKKPKKVLEIGCFNGYSALWFSLFSKKVISLEIDKDNIKMAKENFEKARVKNIEIIEGNAIDSLKALEKDFDVILIDGKKSEYKKYLELSLNLIKKDGIIFVDNTISHKEKLTEFFEFLKQNKLFFKELRIGKGLTLISKCDSLTKNLSENF